MMIRTVLFALLILNSHVLLAESERDPHGWEFRYTPYAWIAYIKTDAEFEESPGEPVEPGGQTRGILDVLDMAYMHNLQIQKGRWGLMNEIIYLDMSDQTTPNSILIDSIDARVILRVFDLAASYEVNNKFMLLFGWRHIATDMDVNIDFPLDINSKNISLQQHWHSPVLAFRYSLPLGKKWSLAAQADYADDLDQANSFMATALLNYKLTNLLNINLGYRYAEVDLQSDVVSLDYALGGYLLGVSFQW